MVGLQGKVIEAVSGSEIHAQGRKGSEQARTCARSSALAEIHGKDAVARAFNDLLALEAFSDEYFANILTARRRTNPEPDALQPSCCTELIELKFPSTTVTQET